ncbi:MAG: undecaprenyldiphospho-muramoylpentapeptide beta-N-acetylglucosaminyltransferase [Parasporobacterium sp.]|nr:undecaprenyldiphospho-muramoylpentapeptide beta-N-acetylglucosaminyltransferase [Parasporobacterium sp.]
MKRILLTGGGTAGHVTPNLALVPYLRQAGFEIEYMGSYEGIEKGLVEAAGIPYYGISSGKLRRYLDVKNLTDPARILKGLHEARRYMKTHRPDVVFSKGGFVSVPVIMAASERRIPIVIHESDLSPGLANKLSIPRATRVCFSFPETSRYLSQSKSVHTGLPVRQELMNGSREEGLAMTGFDGNRPVLTVIGGSLGSLVVNEAVRASLPDLMQDFQVIHICGKGKTDPSLDHLAGYRQYEYVNEELPHLFAASDLVISRAGANVINELAALKKPSVLIPLGTNASRGDQLLNAESFRKRGFSAVIKEEDLTADALASTVRTVYTNRASYIETMQSAAQDDAAAKVAGIILSVLKS